MGSLEECGIGNGLQPGCYDNMCDLIPRQGSIQCAAGFNDLSANLSAISVNIVDDFGKSIYLLRVAEPLVASLFTEHPKNVKNAWIRLQECVCLEFIALVFYV